MLSATENIKATLPLTRVFVCVHGRKRLNANTLDSNFRHKSLQKQLTIAHERLGAAYS